MKNIFIIIFFSFISLFSSAQWPKYDVTVYDASSTEGYYFLSTGPDMIIMDNIGSPVFYRHGRPCLHFTMQPNGIMTYADTRQVYFMDSTFTVFDSISCKNNYDTDSHDFRIMPNGHFLLLGAETIKTDLSHYNFTNGKGSDTANIRYAVIQEQDANRNVVFEWHAKDYFNFDDADTSFFHLSAFGDIMHSNALELDHDGNLLLCSRNLNEVTKINRTDGSIMWHFGGKRNQFKFVNCPVPFYGQHDIRRINNGHVTLYDNGINIVSHGARAMEFDLDEKNKIAILKWSYTYDPAKYSEGKGNVQRLKNSNTLINFGGLGNDNICFAVVDSNGKKLSQVNNIHSNRVTNFPSLPWQLHRPQITCFDSLGMMYLKTTKDYTSYQWSDSSHARIIPVTKPGLYYVFVPYGQGGYISSEKFIITDISHPCEALPVKKKYKK